MKLLSPTGPESWIIKVMIVIQFQFSAISNKRSLKDAKCQTIAIRHFVDFVVGKDFPCSIFYIFPRNIHM